MAKNPSHTNIPGIDGCSRIPQSSVSRTAKPSKIAKPSAVTGTKLSSLPKSLSNEKICQASNLVQKTTKNLFQSRFGKPPEPKPRAKMNTQQNVPVVQNSTFAVDAVNRPSLTRSETYVREDDNSDTCSKVKPIVSQSVDIGNNLTQNVISKLQEQTFTTNNPVRMSISPVGPSYPFHAPRKMSDEKVCVPSLQISSTPFRNTPINNFSTQYLCEQKLLPPISFDITGTDLDPTTPPQLNSTNVAESTFIYSADIRDTTKPEFLDMCTPVSSRAPSREKFNQLAQDMTEDTLIVDTTLNLYTSKAQNQDTIISKTLVMDNTDNSTLTTTKLLCLGNESRHENTMVPLMPTNGEVMEVDDRGNVPSSAESNAPSSAPVDIQNKQRFSFGQDITEWTLDCSIELCDSSVGSSVAPPSGSPSHLKKQHSFDEKSLSILTPDQMKEFLDSNNTNLNLDLPLFPKMSMHQCRIDQTPSPEELPLDPVGVKTDISDLLTGNDNQMTSGQYVHEQQLSQTDSYSKTDQMTKSAASKVSNSFITSVTSITSLDTGYQGDGELSRPASRGGDHSPSNMPRVHPMRPIVGREPSFMNNNQNIAIVRRQDPMTDSDFFTESDADDIIHRGDRRQAQVIDGQLYAPMQPINDANVNHYVNQQPSTEDSCMESSGIFTDVENRADDEILHRHGHDSDMSPDGSTDTVKSSNTEYNNKKNSTVIQAHTDTFVNHQGHSMSDSTTSTINSSCEKGGDRQSLISEYSINSVHSIQLCDLKCGGGNSHCSLNHNNTQLKSKESNQRNIINDNIFLLYFLEPKHNKNEANVALKKHEMSKSKRVVSGEKIRNGSSSGVLSSVGDIENQENKRPTTGCSSRKVVPNKWDAVMNKIASNKTSVKTKNYNEVKSKVTCGLTKKDSPGLIKSPTVEADLFVTTSKRNFQLSSKRGRTHSQQSSQSDISENVGSSKTKIRTNSNSSPRAAKKRDVRALSNSPNDLASVKSNGKCGNIKPVSLQKRFSSGSPNVSSSPTEQKSSPPPKKFLSKRFSQPAATKTPLKAKEVPLSENGLAALLAEHGGMVQMREGRIVGGLPVPIENVPYIISMRRLGSHRCGGSIITTTRILSAAHCTIGIPGNGFQVRAGSTQHNTGGQLIATSSVINHPQYNSATLNNDVSVMFLVSALNTAPDGVAAIAMPVQGAGVAVGITATVSGWDHNRLVSSGTPTTTILQATPRTIATSPKGTISPKTTQRVLPSNTSSHSIQHATHHGNDIVQTDRIFNNKAHTSANQVDRIVNNGKIENCLNGIGSTRSVITATKATSTIDVVDANLIHANKSVVALGILVKYIVDDLDAFNNPNLKKSNENVTKVLMETKVQLENARLNCTTLENQLAEKHEFYTNREQEIQKHYKSEFSKVESRLSELDRTSGNHITTLETKIISNEKLYEEKLQNVTNQFKATIAEKEAELALAKDNEQEFLKRIRALSSTENELREKILASETEFGERLHLAVLRERELNDKFSLLSKEMTNKESILTEKLNIAQNEILVLRNPRDSAMVNASPKVNKGPPMLLEDEIQSWRSVLEMKQKDLSDLQKRNRELENAAASLPGALAKISGLESRLEDLEIQLKIKNDEEQELLLKNKQLEQSYKYEMKNRTLLSLDNEQLKYRLKRNSEKFSSAIIELTKGQNDSSTLSESSFALNGSDSYYGNADASPPTTPVIKGVVEKTASVSYVLEINDEESPEALASRIIRRAGSFRQNSNERTANRLIQQGNALAQSASATSILRQHSESTANNSPKHDSIIRIRSKSVSTNSNNALDLHERKQSQSNQRDNTKLSPWNKPLCSSSPNSKRSIKAANNSNDNELLLSDESETECSSGSRRSNAENGQYFRRSNSYKHTKRGLITCNTAALTSQRPDLCLSLPVHPTVKELKKFQQIKESAGEAMVSGTNSEDEASTASSDGSLSSRSSSSGRRRSSIEDANIDKIVASLGVEGAGNGTPMELVGTPMEVSWSEDVDHFASDSAV